MWNEGHGATLIYVGASKISGLTNGTKQNHAIFSLIKLYIYWEKEIASSRWNIWAIYSFILLGKEAYIGLDYLVFLHTVSPEILWPKSPPLDPATFIP